MQIQIKNKEYDKVMNDKCAEADRLISQMIGTKYLKSKIMNTAFDKANVVEKSMGTLNVTKQQARVLQKMADKQVSKMQSEELQEYIGAENLFKLSK